VVNGMVLAEDGKKMSKSVRNYTDPSDVMNNFGADALRLFLIDSALLKADDLRYSDDGVKEVLKNVIIPLWNAYSFFVTYANIDGMSPKEPPGDPANPLDRWILSEVEGMIEEVTRRMDAYDLQKAVGSFINFIDLLNNWYIRRSRRRFWRSENDADKQQAYQTLYTVFSRLILVAAPFIPFTTEEIYRNLRLETSPESIHLCDFPTADSARRDQELELKMKVTRQAVSMGRSLRSSHNLKIRQPLRALHLVTKDQAAMRILIEMAPIIKEELNVKEVIFRENEEELVVYRAQPNFRKLGKELGKDMKPAAEAISRLSLREIVSLMEGATLSLDIGTRVLDITQEEISIIREERMHLRVLNEGSLTVALDSELTEELVQEGMVRDLVRSIQNLRKEKRLEVTDRIDLAITGDETIKRAIERFEDHLTSETLAVSWKWGRDEDAIEVTVGEKNCFISLSRAPGS